MLALTARYPQRRAFITGAASGLGLALAERLAGDGWQVGLADVQELRLQRAALQVRALGGGAIPYLLDVTDAAAFHEAAQTFVTAHGGIDLVINNAGIYMAAERLSSPSFARGGGTSSTLPASPPLRTPP
ncbi:MAG: SDR family NAD(P)-dependent oxidoreductase [Bacteroidetes bacterium]|jgi:NAD(P)-dependent dehydrogenase (short-subunit alcohol dehydrogenase family)|nr:SDR family NAD(P)-dependent oxidoreductase [Bacteroidota bacterium]